MERRKDELLQQVENDRDVLVDFLRPVDVGTAAADAANCMKERETADGYWWCYQHAADKPDEAMIVAMRKAGEVAAEQARKRGKTYLVASTRQPSPAVYVFACDHPDAAKAGVTVLLGFPPAGERIRHEPGAIADAQRMIQHGFEAKVAQIKHHLNRWVDHQNFAHASPSYGAMKIALVEVAIERQLATCNEEEAFGLIQDAFSKTISQRSSLIKTAETGIDQRHIIGAARRVITPARDGTAEE